jgi:hypothetical protein
MKAASLLFLLPALLSAAQPAPATFTLPNGLQVALFEDHSLPLVRGELRLDLPAPASDAQAWLRPLGFRMLAAGGSGTRNAAAFELGADAIGLDLRLSSGPDSALWAFAIRSQDQETALNLLADRVTRPIFDPLALEPARLAAWSEISESDSLARAQLRFARALSNLPEPDERALGSMDATGLAAWHRRLFRPDRATLVLWGDLDPSQARQLTLLSLGAWTAQQGSVPNGTPLPPETGPFLSALPGEAPVVSLGLVEDGRDRAGRRFLRPWIATQLKAAGIGMEDGGALVLRAEAPLGTSAESLRARLAAALDALPGSFTEADLALLRTQAATERALMSLHPDALLSGIATPIEAPADLAAAKALLDRWCAPANRRLFASGDPGSLQGLQGGHQDAPQTSTPKR